MPLSIRSPAIRKNPLLIKAEVGKPKPSLQELPQGNHTYGLPSRVKATDHDTTGSVLQQWRAVDPPKKTTSEQRDYIAMNRNSAKKGIIDARELRKDWSSHPVARKANNIHTRADIVKKIKLPSDSNPAFTYGKVERPSTPAASLMTQKYMDKFLKHQVDLDNQEKARLEKFKDRQRVQQAHVAQRRNILAAKLAENSKTKLLTQDPKSLFRMTKFKNVPSKIVTH